MYEEKQINLIQDLYSPCENLEFNKKKITTITGKRCQKETKQIRETIEVDGMENKQIIDVDVNPIIEKQESIGNKILYTGVLEINLILASDDMQMEIRNSKIPFEYTIDNLQNGESLNNKLNMEVINQDFIVQGNGTITANIDLLMDNNMDKNTNINVMNEIQTNGERAEQDYSLILYIVKKGDTLWKIAKQFGSTVDDIVRTNGIEDENKISIGQKLFIPRYVKMGMQYV